MPKAQKTNRQILEALVWKHTHADFRGMWQGKKSVLHKEASTLASLDDLTGAELLSKLPGIVRVKFERECITRAYGERCKNIQIPMLKMSGVYEAGSKAMGEGAIDETALGDRVLAFVETIRVN